MNQLPEKKIRAIQTIVAFTFAAILYVVLTADLKSMTLCSGDAADIWKSITSFHKDDMYGSMT